MQLILKFSLSNSHMHKKKPPKHFKHFDTIVWLGQMYSIQQWLILVFTSLAYLHFGETAKCYFIKLHTNSAAVLGRSKKKLDRARIYRLFTHNIELRGSTLLSGANMSSQHWWRINKRGLPSFPAQQSHPDWTERANERSFATLSDQTRHTMYFRESQIRKYSALPQVVCIILQF